MEENNNTFSTVACKPSQEWFEQELDRLSRENCEMRVIIRLLLEELERVKQDD